MTRSQLLDELETDDYFEGSDHRFNDDVLKEELMEKGFHLDERLTDWESQYVNQALQMSGGNLSKAAKLLGINRTTLYSRLERLNINNNAETD